MQVKVNPYPCISLTDFYFLSSRFDLSDLASEASRAYIPISRRASNLFGYGGAAMQLGQTKHAFMRVIHIP